MTFIATATYGWNVVRRGWGSLRFVRMPRTTLGPNDADSYSRRLRQFGGNEVCDVPYYG